jgi:dihydrofolate reductase
MGRLVYTAITSLDGYVNDIDGRFDWSAPDPEVHQFVNDAERGVGTYLYGRRMYEVMRSWQDVGVDTTVAAGPDADRPDAVRDYARVWRAADKVVFSRTLDAVTTPRTRLERTFDPDGVRQLLAAADGDVSVGGPGLAAAALAAGLVDELGVFLSPVVVGGGTRWLPDAVRVELELVDEHRFGNGVVHLRYRVR